MSQSSSFAKQLDELIELTCSTEEKLLRLLQMGCDKFDLLLGIISEITDPKYKVLSAYPEGLVNRGDEYDLRETICDITKLKNEVTSFAKASGTKWTSHPAYDKFSVEAYIGIPYFNKGKIAGTLNFSSPSAHPKGFTFNDDENIQIMARAVEKIISKKVKGSVE